MKGIRIHCSSIKDINKELKENVHETISNLIITSKLKVPIVGINRETGSTNWHDNAERDNQRYAFGIPRWFCRFSFTSAINDVPFMFVSWIKFTMESVTKTCFIGHISANEWNLGPFIHKSDDINPFCSIDYIMPSRFDKKIYLNKICFNYFLFLYMLILLFSICRFAMAYEDYNAINTEIGFLSLDPDRINEDMTGGSFTDLGEDFDLSGVSSEISPNMVKFLNCVI